MMKINISAQKGLFSTKTSREAVNEPCPKPTCSPLLLPIESRPTFTKNKPACWRWHSDDTTDSEDRFVANSRPISSEICLTKLGKKCTKCLKWVDVSEPMLIVCPSLQLANLGTPNQRFSTGCVDKIYVYEAV
jgi:hypothetical protein